jgi:hypothetical protein
MLVGVLTLLIMAGVTYAFWREGLLTAATMSVNVFLAGMVAFAFWEPIADALSPLLAGSVLSGYEDAVCMVLLFAVTLGLLRLATNNLANAHLEYHPVLRQAGIVLFGMVAGYLASGFLLCVLQTLPWHSNFMQFDYHVDKNAGGPRTPRVLPPDHAWLALMHGAMPDFDPDATFEATYARFRRYDDNHDAGLPYQGEFGDPKQREGQ